MFFGVSLLLAFPLILISWLESLILGREGERIYGDCGEILSVIPTILGSNLRTAFYWATCTSVSRTVSFQFGSWLAHRDNTIAQGVMIGAHTLIGYADIGENTIVGARVSVVSGKYQHGRPAQRVSGKEITEEHVVVKIGRNSWIGQDVVLLANVGDNCTVGAGSVVLRDVANNATVIGNPARKVSV